VPGPRIRWLWFRDYAGLREAGDNLRAGEPLGADRQTTGLRHQQREGQIRFRGVEQRPGKPDKPVIIGPDDWTVAHPALNRLVGHDWGHLFVSVQVGIPVFPAAAKKSRPSEAAVLEAVKNIGNLPPDKLWPQVQKTHPSATRQQVRNAREQQFGARPAHRPRKPSNI
jgi:hypothetical protein